MNDLSMKLSPNFTLGELVASQSAARRGLDNTPSPQVIGALKDLCVHVLQPLREHFDRPVVVSSGYRSIAVNKSISGSSTSQHTKGEAADFTIPGISNLAVCQWIQRNLKYDQLIYEFGESGWIHCSYRVGRLRSMDLRAVRVGRATKYLPGLVT